MTKEVMIAIRGLQFDQEQDSDEIETIQPGEYYKRNGAHYVIFQEYMEGFPEPVRNMIKFREHSMELTKKGPIDVHMVFEQNKKNVTNYRTPYGMMLIGLDTGKVEVEEEEHRVTLHLGYTLDVNYEYVADCTICLDIRDRQAADFDLTGTEKEEM